MINPSVFKAYDVRGLYPSEITEDLFHQLGRAFVAYLGPGQYAVTRDMRVSSPSLTKAFIDGARRCRAARSSTTAWSAPTRCITPSPPTASTAARRSPRRTIPASTTAARWSARKRFR